METSQYREPALAWWRSRTDSIKMALFAKYYPATASYFASASGGQIENIYIHEKITK